jgi:2-polyprenyl-3-methyl-5-hydroxy-6-metoxy-1,4-benzoquinol methylase
LKALPQMIGDNTDRSWEMLGRQDPYYGVLTDEKFRNAKLDAGARQEFFASGSVHMAALLQRIEATLGPIARGRALEFGCGVGRLAIPLKRDAGFAGVVGADISESMLQEARRNAQDANLGHIDFVLSDDQLSRLDGAFDFVHSFIVLQHIPVARGEVIVRRLMESLAPGGVAALQLPFARRSGVLRNLANYTRVHVRPVHMLGNLLQGRPWNEAPMQMNRYDLNKLFVILHECGLARVIVEFMDDGGNTGAYLLVRRPA